MKELKSIIDDIEKPGVYFLYNKDKDLIYIGKSKNLSGRVYASSLHIDAEFVKFAFTETEELADIYEAFYIIKHEPPENRYIPKKVPDKDIRELPKTEMYRITDGISYKSSEINVEPIIFKINPDLKKKFKVKVTQDETDMSKKIKQWIREYVK